MTNSIIEIIRSRRTVGAYHPEVPPWELVAKAIDAACWAPNHRKTEPWRFYAIGPVTAQAIVELNASLIAAKSGADAADAKRKQWSTVPGWLAITCLKTADPFLQEEDYAACCCAVQNLMLHLWHDGIGTKWSTGEITRHPDYFQTLGIPPDQERSVGLISYGYPAKLPAQTRRPVCEVLHRLP